MKYIFSGQIICGTASKCFRKTFDLEMPIKDLVYVENHLFLVQDKIPDLTEECLRIMLKILVMENMNDFDMFLHAIMQDDWTLQAVED